MSRVQIPSLAPFSSGEVSMSGIILLLLLILGTPIALLIWLGTKASRADRGVRDLEARFASLQYQLDTLRRELRVGKPVEVTPPAATPSSRPASVPVTPIAP